MVEAAVAVVDEKATGLAKVAATQTFHGETNATDAKSRKVIDVLYISHDKNVHLRPRFKDDSLEIETTLLICFYITII